jgi:hypothetical protein
MRRATVVISLIVLAALSVSPAATATPPTQERIVVDDFDTVPAGELCEFPVEVVATGRVLVTTHHARVGSVDFISERPNIRITASNPSSGRFVTDRDVGLDKQVFNPDGTSDVLSTGIHFRTKTQGGGVIFRRIGLQILHLDAGGEVTSIEIVGGNFDDFDEIDEVLCGALA